MREIIVLLEKIKMMHYSFFCILPLITQLVWSHPKPIGVHPQVG